MKRGVPLPGGASGKVQGCGCGAAGGAGGLVTAGLVMLVMLRRKRR